MTSNLPRRFKHYLKVVSPKSSPGWNELNSYKKIISKLIGRTAPVNSKRSGNAFQTSAETVGGADLAKDHGYSTWIELSKGSDINFQLGYTRSAGYDLNSVFFSVGFNVSSLIRKNRS